MQSAALVCPQKSIPPSLVPSWGQKHTVWPGFLPSTPAGPQTTPKASRVQHHTTSPIVVCLRQCIRKQLELEPEPAPGHLAPIDDLESLCSSAKRERERVAGGMPDLLARRSSANSQVQECGMERRVDWQMPRLEPLPVGCCEDTRKEEPSSPKMPMLLPAVTKGQDEDEDLVTKRTNSLLSRFGGNVEVDSIDGVEFYSFSSAEDLMVFTRSMDRFPCTGGEDAPGAAGVDDVDEEDWHVEEEQWTEQRQAVVVLPRKTTDITKIKGWRKKAFGVEQTAEEITEQTAKQTTQWVVEQMNECAPQRRPEQNESLPPPVSTPIVKQEPVVERKVELSKRVRCAFVSDSLDEFLERRAELRVSQLSQLNPNIVPLPEGKGVLSLTVLEKRLTKATGAGRNPRQVDPATGLRGPQATTGGRYGNARAMAIAGRALAAQASVEEAAPATKESPSPPKQAPVEGKVASGSRRRMSTQALKEDSLDSLATPPRARVTRSSDASPVSKRPKEEEAPFLAMTTRKLRLDDRAIPTTKPEEVEPVAEPNASTEEVIMMKSEPPSYGDSSDNGDLPLVQHTVMTERQLTLLGKLLASTQCSRPLTVAVPLEPTFLCPQLDTKDATAAAQALATPESVACRKLFPNSPKTTPPSRTTPRRLNATKLSPTTPLKTTPTRTSPTTPLDSTPSKLVPDKPALAKLVPPRQSSARRALNKSPAETAKVASNSGKVEPEKLENNRQNSAPAACKLASPNKRRRTMAERMVDDFERGRTAAENGQIKRSRRPIRLPARFQDSALLFHPHGEIWDASFGTPPKAKARQTAAEGSKTPPAQALPPCSSALGTSWSTEDLRSSSSSCSSVSSSSSTSSSFSCSSCYPSPSQSLADNSTRAKDDSSCDDSDCQVTFVNGKPKRGHTPMPLLQRTAGLVNTHSLTSTPSGEHQAELQQELDIDNFSDCSESQMSMSQLGDEQEEGSVIRSDFAWAEDADSAAKIAADLMGKASKERERRRTMLGLFMRLQNNVFRCSDNTILPKVSILGQAMRYLSCLKALSLHLDGEKRRLRRHHSALQACLSAARKGQRPIPRMKPLKPRPVPLLIAKVCDLNSPTFGPLLEVSQAQATPMSLPGSKPSQAAKRVPSRQLHHHSGKAKSTKQRSSRHSSAVGKHAPQKSRAVPAAAAAAAGKAKQRPPKAKVSSKGSKPVPEPTPKAPQQSPPLASKPGTSWESSEGDSHPEPKLGVAVGLQPATENAMESAPISLSYKLDSGRIGSLRSVPMEPGQPAEPPVKYTLYPAKGTVLGDLSKVAAAAQHLIGPCVIKRVKLRTGQTVFVYRQPSATSNEGLDDSGAPHTGSSNDGDIHTEPLEDREDKLQGEIEGPEERSWDQGDMGEEGQGSRGEDLGDDGEERGGEGEDLEDTSEWVTGDGETCIVTKLPVDSEDDSEEDDEGDEETTSSESS